jgi:hypothetical protein
MMTDVILGAAMGYTAAQVRPFLHSLRRAGFAGEVVLFVTPALSPPDRAAMKAAGATLVFVQRELCRLPKRVAEGRFTPRLHPVHRRAGPLLGRLPGRVGREAREWYSCAFNHPVSSRFAYYRWYLEPRLGRYRRVLLSDVRDVVFQADPFADPFPAPLLVALDPGCWTMTSCQSNRLWMIDFLGQAAFDRVAGERVSCAGTVFGTAPAVLHYAQRMTGELVKVADRTLGRFGPDQSVHNYLFWSGQLPGAAAVENGRGVVFTARGEDMSRFRIADGVLYNFDGRPVPVVHQYDRVPELGRLAAVLAAGANGGGG